jgi:DNA-binding beta-propeller fold protein YncE/mono/diheme cytochrome c family protein
MPAHEALMHAGAGGKATTMRTALTSLTILPLALAGAAACGTAGGGVRPSAPQGAAPPAILARPCARVHAAGSAPSPLSLPRTGSTIALAAKGGKTLAYAADEDDWAVHVIDVDAGKELGETPLDGRPSQLLFLADGRLVVLLRDKSLVQVLEPGDAPEVLERRCSVETASEPVGLALSPDDTMLLVASGWGRALGAFDARTMSKVFEVPLAREPRSVVVSEDGKFAYVSHAVGAKASRVTLAERTVSEISLHAHDAQRGAILKSLAAQVESLQGSNQPVPDSVREDIKEAESSQPSCQGYALAKSIGPGGRILAPQVLVDTGDPSARASGYGNDEASTEVPDVAVIDATTGEALAASLERPVDAFGWGNVDPRDAKRPECLLPRAAVVEESRKSLLVSCFGIDQVIEYDSLAASPARAERQRWTVAAGPSGIAVDGAKNRAVVWSQFDRAVSVIDLGAGKLVDDQGQLPRAAPRIAMAANVAHKMDITTALGRLLFHSVGDARISRDGRACASCHPDGRDDSLVWSTPEGPRRSIMLAGRVRSTAPYAWSGSHSDLKVHLATTFDRLNGAGGLKSVELDALAAYVESLAPPPPLPLLSREKVDRGAKLFASSEVGCAGCHAGTGRTDNQSHDVKSKTSADRNELFNTPTLRFVGGTGPYFHDGRYGSLHELLLSDDDRMGRTKQLSPEDLEALEAYLRSL